MTRLIILTALAGVLGALFTPAYSFAGGVVDVLEAAYKPLMQTRDGRIHNCGVHFSLAVTVNGRALGIQGSVNEFFFKNKMPSIAFKITVVEASQGQLVRHNLTSAFLRGQNFSTTNFFFNEPSPENGAWLAMTNMEKQPNLFSRFILSLADRPWIGFNIGDGLQDFTAQLPTPKEQEVFKDSLSCSILAIKQFQKELKSLKK